MHEMKRIRILADPYLFALTLLVIISCWRAVVFVSILSADPSLWKNEQDKVISLGVFILPVLAGSCLSLFWDTRWANVLVLSHQKIELRSCFKKPVVYAYEEYPYIYRATYRHSIVGAPDVGPEIVYLVLSRRRLSSFEKTHINQVSSATDVIKIKFSKSRYQLLMESMPPKLSREVERTFAPYI